MSDLALTWNAQRGAGDFAIVANDYVGEDGMETDVIASLFSNAPAQAGDELPDGTIAKGGEGGWWADAVPVVPGDAFGSRLWLLSRAKRIASTLTRAQAYAFEALQWLVSDKIASAIAVNSSFNAKGWLVLEVTIDRPNQSRVTYRYDPVWLAEASRP
jgi:phage gp46-like protein